MTKIINRKKICLLLISFLPAFFSAAQNITKPNILGPLGVRVNSFTGNMFYQRTDFYIKGRMPLDISFSYNSADRNRNTGYGRGWTFNYGMKYRVDSIYVTIIRNDGRKDVFTPVSGNPNLFNGPAGIFDKLTKSGSNYQLTSKDGTKYFFNDASHKRLTRVEDRNLNGLNFTYADTLVTGIADDAGRTLQLAYSAGKLLSVTDANGTPTRTYTYAYDNAGNLTTVTDPMSFTQEYSYVINGPLNTIKDRNGNTVDIIYNSSFAVKEIVTCLTRQTINYSPNSNTTSVTELVGSVNQLTTYRFDLHGNLLQKSGNCCGYNVSYEYDSDKNISKRTDANGKVTTYTYDGKGNMLSETDPLGHTAIYTYEPNFNNVASFKDKNGNTTGYTYNAQGNLTQIAKPLSVSESYTYAANGDATSYTDGRGNTTTFTYDANGNLTAVQRPLSSVTAYTYDAKSRRLTETDPLSHTTTYAYDALDRVTTVTDALSHNTVYAYDPNGNVAGMTDANNHTTTYAYDALDRKVKITDALGKETKMAYDAKGNLTAMGDANGNTTTYAYDELSRLVNKTNAMGEATSYAYDGNGNVISTIYPNGNNVTMTYDGNNRLTQSSDVIGTISSYNYDNEENMLTKTDGNGNSMTYIYDALNRVISISDALGRFSTIIYDKNNNVVSSTDRNNHTTIYIFDALNRRINLINPLSNTTSFSYNSVGNLTSITDANNHTTSYTYDELNRNIVEAFADGTSKTYTYDAVGNILTRLDANGATTSYTYDAVNRLTVKNYPGPNDDLYTYDNIGKMLTANNNNASLTFAYNSANRLINESLNGKNVQYQYNILGKNKTIIYPGGRIIIENYDERNRLNSLNESNNSIAEFKFDKGNRLSRISYINGTITDIAYDSDNRVTSMLSNPGSFLNFTYTYDNEGNKLLEKKNHQLNNSETYMFDNLNRIIQNKRGVISGSTIPNPIYQVQYNYDGLGNRTNVIENGNIISYTTNSVNAYTNISGLSTIVPLYDNNGNLVSEGSLNFSYNSNNRLISINNGSISAYKYDPLGRRIQKEVGGQIINYYYLGQRIVEERDAVDSIQATYVYGIGIDQVLNVKKGNNNYFYYSNNVGTICLIKDINGVDMEHYEYDPYGKVTIFDSGNNVIPNSVINNSFSFTGRQMDFESDNYYFRLRNYDPKVGRFNQKDPLDYIDGLNAYQFVRNNPLRYIDPNGTESSNATCNLISGKPPESPPLPSADISSCERYYSNPEIARKFTWPLKKNTISACSVTGDNEQMNSIRKFLQEYFADNEPIDGKQFSAKELEEAHDKAYKNAGCKGLSAGYLAWLTVNHIPFSDGVIKTSIDWFGNCSNPNIFNNGKTYEEKGMEIIDWIGNLLVPPAY